MSIPTVVTTTVPSIVNTTTSITSAIPSVTSAIPSVTNAATSVANAVPSMVNAASSISNAISSLPPLPSMNSISNTASNVGSDIVNTGSSIANSAIDKGKEAISLIDKLIRDLGNLFTLKGLHNLSYFLLNIFIILILIHLINKKDDSVPKLYLYGLYSFGFAFIIFYILSYIFEEDNKKHENKNDKSDLSTPPIVVK
jgi:hypothetical protein